MSVNVLKTASPPKLQCPPKLKKKNNKITHHSGEDLCIF